MWNEHSMDQTMPTTHLYVDADSCPVKDEILTYRFEPDVKLVFVMSYAHMMTLPPEVGQVMVDSDKEAVDLHIMNHVKKGDVCVTQDHALASLLLKKGVIALSPRGIGTWRKRLNFCCRFAITLLKNVEEASERKVQSHSQLKIVIDL